ncbi:hypothetical protein KO481_26310 [Nocardia sp. NEAU-G5]|uniref:Uncharacterized protein n=1 Tax=Nocardia albiluteola TaxID=2842303 RepID=A0ABS6B412_9NOCA|nr:hypothetical protein [Nocardia albiluteola]MBU3065031.1 hypothetical protein [Nocardia albiluteola]
MRRSFTPAALGVTMLAQWACAGPAPVEPAGVSTPHGMVRTTAYGDQFTL